jgi:hypothetical protein
MIKKKIYSIKKTEEEKTIGIAIKQNKRGRKMMKKKATTM